MEQKKIVSGLICSILIVMSLFCFTSSADETFRAHVVDKSDTAITIFDSAGRVVHLPYPIQTVVVLWSNPAEEMIALDVEDRIIGVDQSAKDKADSGIYPSLQGIPSVGSYADPNYEKIADLNPDVVLMLSTYPPLPDEVAEKLEPFGIPVVALDFYRVEVWSDEIKTLGAMLGVESKAEKFLSFMNDPQAMITERISVIPESARLNVFFEGNNDYQAHGGAGYGGGVPGIIRAVGGRDLFYDREEVSFDADPEEVARRNPDFHLKGTTLGYKEESTTGFEELYAGVVSREELQGTNALINDNVWVISWDIAGGARKKFGPMYLAKIFYPDLLADFDPDMIYKQYLTEYLKIPDKGVVIYPAIS